MAGAHSRGCDGTVGGGPGNRMGACPLAFIQNEDNGELLKRFVENSGMFAPKPARSPVLLTPADCPTIQFSSDATWSWPQIPPAEGLSPTRPHVHANHKHRASPASP